MIESSDNKQFKNITRKHNTIINNDLFQYFCNQNIDKNICEFLLTHIKQVVILNIGEY
jgi:hypothetical protein